MPKTKYSKEYLKNHFFYSRWVYLVVVLVALGAAEITFTVTRYQAPNARRVDIELLGGYADLSNTADAEKALLAAGQAYELARDEANGVDTSASDYEVPLQEVGIYNINYSGTVSDNDDYYAGQKYMVMLAAQEGDIYIVTREMLGSETQYKIRLSDATIMVKIPDDSFRENQKVWVMVPRKDVHFFDEEGKHIGHGGPDELVTAAEGMNDE